MNINRDNYEMIFLLYVDNELSAEERKSVEAFAELNPDLGIELSILKETVLPADNVSFGNKADLFKSTEQDAIQEKLLLHLDNELEGNDKTLLEKQLASNAELQKDFQILQKTKLDPSEIIVFSDKQSLYRYERSRVIVMRITRLAIAAVFIGAGLFFGYKFMNQADTAGITDPVASNADAKTTPGKSTQLSNNTASELPAPSARVADDIKKTNLLVAQSTVRQVKDAKPGQVTRSQQQQIAQTNKIEPSANTAKVNQEAQDNTRLLAMNNQGKSVEKISPERTPEEMELAKINRVARPSVTDVNLATVDNSMARTAGITNLEEPDEDKILYVDEDKVTRTKAAGFLRKLKRTVERNTRIKTGNGVRIAGFEFAVK